MFIALGAWTLTMTIITIILNYHHYQRNLNFSLGATLFRSQTPWSEVKQLIKRNLCGPSIKNSDFFSRQLESLGESTNWWIYKITKTSSKTNSELLRASRLQLNAKSGRDVSVNSIWYNWNAKIKFRKKIKKSGKFNLYVFFTFRKFRFSCFPEAFYSWKRSFA